VETGLQIFNNPEFGEIRFVEVDGKPYAVGVDVARALGYAKPSQAVIDHCKGIRKLRIPSDSGVQETNIIPEGDIYRLIIKAADQSRNEEIRNKAERFERWVFDEILPTIRKTGSYQLPGRTVQQKKALPDKVFREELANAAIFARVTGIRRERAVAVAIARAENRTGESYAEYRKLLPPVEPDEAEILTPTQIGELLGKKAADVNLLLEEMKLQYGIREAGKKPGSERLVKRNPWRLTEMGKQYGIMQDSAREMNDGKKWEGFQIFWKPVVVDMLRDHIAEKERLTTESG